MKKSMMKNLLALIISLFIMFIIAEIGLRFILVPASFQTQQIQNSENEIISYELKKKMEIVDRGPIIKLRPITVRTNSFGLREDEEHDFVKDEEKIRIAMIGDSVTFGMYVEQNETFGNRIEELLGTNYETADLSRRVAMYQLPALSFREFLEIETSIPFEIIALEEARLE